MIEARALKNRFHANTIGKILNNYRSFEINNQIDRFEKIVRDSLQSQAKTAQFMSLITQIINEENKYLHFDSVIQYEEL